MARTPLVWASFAILAAIPLPTGGQMVDAKPAADYKAEIAKGLAWLAKAQHKDGYWEERGDFRVPMTAMAGLAFLSEGSAPGRGKYGKQLDRAVEYLLGKQGKNGLFSDMENDNDRHRYMHGHGFAIMFLSQCYSAETALNKRKELELAIGRAIDFTAKAQTSTGGWGYVSAADGNDFSENIATMPQVQSIFAARKAGIAVPRKLIDKMLDHLKLSTAPAKKDGKAVPGEAGVLYSAAMGGGEPRETATAGALASCLIGNVDAEMVTLWLNYCQTKFTLTTDQWTNYGLSPIDYIHYFLSQAAYLLGEDGHAKMAKDRKGLLRWSDYRKSAFPAILSRQNEFGGFDDTMPIFAASVSLIVLQLEKGHLPMCER